MIDVETSDGVTVWTLSHGRANALDLEFLQEMTSKLEQFRVSPARALVMTARGRIFCAGVDLKRLLNSGAEYFRRFVPTLNDLVFALATLPKPVVCAANGHAIAGGAILMFAADWRLIADGDLRVGVPELVVGVPFPTVAMELVRRLTPAGRLSQVVLEGRSYTPSEALELGWVNELAPLASLQERSLTRAKQLAALPEETFRLTKEHLCHPLVEFVRGPGKSLDRRVQAAWESPEVLAAVRRYVERTLAR